MDKRKDQINSKKVEQAKRIASQSRKIASSFENMEAGFFRFFRSFSTLLDHLLFGTKHAGIVSLIIAVMLFAIVNFNSQDSVFGSSLLYSRAVNNVDIATKYSETTYELSGLPEDCSVTLTGDAGSVTSAASNNGYCLIDLEGLVEGTHTVYLQAIGYGDAVEKVITPTSVSVTLKKKTTGQFVIGYDFINTDKMDDVYVLGTPEFASSKVNVRASQDTLDSIAFVKALIDVDDVSEEFTQQAKLVAYNTSGLPVVADIVPSTIDVTVPVKSPSKIVPIVLETTGKLEDGFAIESIDMDHQTVTIYAPESVLAQVEQVTVSIDSSTLTKDTKIVQPIILPNGVSTSDITKVNVDIKLGQEDTKLITKVSPYFTNNENGYKFLPDKAYFDVNVYGTVTNIENITATDIRIYFDMMDAVIGENEFALRVVQNTNPYIYYELVDSTISGIIEDSDATEGDN
jgi:YbbR domain-containing protein